MMCTKFHSHHNKLCFEYISCVEHMLWTLHVSPYLILTSHTCIRYVGTDKLMT